MLVDARLSGRIASRQTTAPMTADSSIAVNMIVRMTGVMPRSARQHRSRRESGNRRPGSLLEVSDEARRRQAESIAAKRLGRPGELGAACAFLCSVHAGYISGRSLHLDGGSYPGLI
jgi:NAD(P)-dependent dehydrogenase (short-subunit alcohol dehydrogenase family)